MGKETNKKLKPQVGTHLRVLERNATLPLEDMSSEDLMLEHGQGSEQAFELLVHRHQKQIMNYIYRMVQNRQVAEEIAQEQSFPLEVYLSH